MRINNYSLGMESTSTRMERVSVTKTYGAISAGQTGGMPGFFGMLDTDVNNEEDQTSSDNAKAQAGADGNSLTDFYDRMNSTGGVRKVNMVTQRENTMSAIERFRQQCMEYIYELIFGHREKTGGESNRIGWNENCPTMELTPVSQSEITVTDEILYSYTEAASFSTKGTVVTSDGRSIEFNLDVSMSQSFTQYTKSTYKQAINCMDPLVINLDIDTAEVTDQKFFFDLNCDGEEEELHTFGSGSGMLALDKNQNGTIDDGSELFGTQSGNGFYDLAGYDEDGNGWIDENDSVFEQLKIWCKNPDGSDSFYTLKEKGVGAIALANSVTDFVYRDGDTIDSDAKARLRSTGVFLFESGMAGTMQQVDLAM